MSKIVKHNGDMITENRRARYDYEIIDQYEAGIQLMGTEVKSLRLGQGDIKSAHANIENGEAFLHGVHIAEYKQAGAHLQHQPTRPRKLLLKANEIKKLVGSIEQKGMTLVPLKLFFNKRGLVKCLLGLAKGKKAHEKRDSIKQRDWERRQQKIMKKEY